MIGPAFSLWFERQGKCPSCNRLIGVKELVCPHCEHKLSQEESVILNEAVKNQFKYSAIAGFLLIIVFMAIVGSWFTK